VVVDVVGVVVVVVIGVGVGVGVGVVVGVVVVVVGGGEVDRRIIAVAGESVIEEVELPFGVKYVAPRANVCELEGLGLTTTVPPLKLRRQPTPTCDFAALG
jgi:hypothetical protein